MQLIEQQIKAEEKHVNKQSNKITNNALKAVDINNKPAINAADAARENLNLACLTNLTATAVF
jgi:hypothetical protein